MVPLHRDRARALSVDTAVRTSTALDNANCCQLCQPDRQPQEEPLGSHHREVLLPTLGLSPGFEATICGYCQLVRRPTDRLLVVDLQEAPQNRLVRMFPYSLYEHSHGETLQRAELALQTASEKTARLRQLMERHDIGVFTYSLRFYHQVAQTVAELYTEHKTDVLVIGREFDLGKNFVTDLAKLVPAGLVILP